jgi:hypothetical protein
VAGEKKLTRLATLTLDGKKIPRGVRSDRYIRECWRKMRVVMAREFGQSLDFIGTLEFQKNGNAHLHLLIGRYIKKSWLSEAWQSIGGGEIVDITYVDVHRVSAYLTIYLAGNKIENTLKQLAPRARIFTTSRSITLWPKKTKNKMGWWLRRKHFQELHDAVSNPSDERYTEIEDLKPFGLKLLTYFEGPPIQEAIGNRDPISVLRAAIPVWKARTS